jgi:DNA-binding transcriptional LysR family regulator
LVEALSSTFSSFMRNFPKATLQVVAVDRAVGLIDERIDVAVRVRAALGTGAALTMRTLGRSSRILVAACRLRQSHASAQTDERRGITSEARNQLLARFDPFLDTIPPRFGVLSS